jgi:hypothetical protein
MLWSSRGLWPFLFLHRPELRSAAYLDLPADAPFGNRQG